MYSEKVRIYPTKSQKKTLDNILYKCKELYNYLLDSQYDYYEFTKKSVKRFDYEQFSKKFDVEGIPGHVRQNVCFRAYVSVRRFLDGISKHPKYKNFHNYRSITFPEVRKNSSCNIEFNSKIFD